MPESSGNSDDGAVSRFWWSLVALFAGVLAFGATLLLIEELQYIAGWWE